MKAKHKRFGNIPKSFRIGVKEGRAPKRGKAQRKGARKKIA